MKQIKQILGSAFLLTLTFAFSSCEGALDDIFGEWDRPANGISFDKTEINFTSEGASEQLTVTFSPENTHPKDLTWKSSDETVATVDANGKVTSVDVGVTQITATTANGKTATCDVNVYGVEFETDKTDLLVGKDLKLYPTIAPHGATVKSFVSSDVTIATVADVSTESTETHDLILKVHGDKVGTAKISVTITADGVDYTDEIEINVVGVTLNITKIGLYPDGSSTVTLEATCGGTEKVASWSIDEPTIATLSGQTTGASTATAKVTSTTVEGVAKVTVTTDASHTATCEVVVKEFGLPLSEFISKDMVDYAIGGVLTAEGNVFTSIKAAISEGETPVAMVAYAGQNAGYPAPYDHGLAIALTDESSKMIFETARNTVEAKTAPTIGSYKAKWAVPTKQAWKCMMESFGGESNNILGLNATLEFVGGAEVAYDPETYWTCTWNTTRNGKPYLINFLSFKSDTGKYRLRYEDGLGELNTRAVIAF